ncbi:MAG: hypothetical protein R3E65_11820 [Steroidobacteraceae bacterium]
MAASRQAGVILEHLGDAEVEQVGFALGIDQDVAGLEVAMHDEIAVRVVDGTTHFHHQLESRAGVERVPVAPGIDRCALDILQHQVGDAVVAAPAIEQSRNVRMRQRGEDLPLGFEACLGVDRDDRRVQQLDGGTLIVSPVGALGPVDGAHAAVGDVASDTPWAEPFTDAMARNGIHDVGGGRTHAAVYRVIGNAVLFEQTLDRMAQRGVPATLARDERRAGLLRQLDCSVEDLL